MTSGVPAARRALARGATAEALVHLWNELEPARLSGERGRLDALGRLAEEIRQRGDEAERHEAERLLRELREQADAAQAVAPATAVLDAEVARTDGAGDAGPAPEPADEAEAPAEGGSPLGGLANWLWLVFVVLIVLANILGGLRD